MFNKIRKKSIRKGLKIADAESSALDNGSVTVNHASRTTHSPLPVANCSQQSPVLADLPNLGVVEILPSLKNASPVDRSNLFARKIQTCCVFFDFSNPLKSVREKEIKRQILGELVDLVQSGPFKLSEIMQQELVWMVSINIFRCLPPTSCENMVSEGLDPEEDDQFLDPSWPHLQILYELLLRYIVSPDTDIKVAKRYIDPLFVLKLIDLFDSEDPNEREYLKTILHRIYGKFMVHRPFIRQAINNVFYRFIFETGRHSGIGELLEILGSIINGFALPMKQEHKLFLVRALIPLHKPKMIFPYHQQLSYCVIQFVEKDCKLSNIVITGLLKCWPVTNCQKEVLFLGELEEILEATQSEEFQNCMVPLFKQIGKCLNSHHFQVAERALFLWNNEHIVSLIAQNRDVIFPIIFEPLEMNLKGHWSQAVQGLTVNILRMFQDMDIELFEACEKKHSKKQSEAKEVEKKRELVWKRLEDVASQIR